MPDTGFWPSGDGVFRALCHDLVQPVAAILLTADRDQDADPRWQMIYRQATWMNEVIERALVATSVANTDPVHVGDVVAAAVERARTHPTSEIHYVRDPDGWARICVSTLGRAVSCILDNAVRASAGGCVDVRVSATDDAVTIDVVDDGPGVGNLPTVHGIGLDVARANLAPYDAQLSLHSAQPRGTRAQIRVPKLISPTCQ
ncbi:MAG: HAMP domain-containing sensor histidine kinase [Ornithinimicrobium sp.]